MAGYLKIRNSILFLCLHTHKGSNTKSWAHKSYICPRQYFLVFLYLCIFLCVFLFVGFFVTVCEKYKHKHVKMFKLFLSYAHLARVKTQFDNYTKLRNIVNNHDQCNIDWSIFAWFVPQAINNPLCLRSNIYI